MTDHERPPVVGLRLCLQCKYFKPRRGDSPGCGFPLSEDCAPDARINPITGHAFQHVDLSLFRMAVCGWTDPKYFKAREPQS